MGCEKGTSAQDISIPVVLIPKSGGQSLNKSIVDGQKGEHCFFTVFSFFAMIVINMPFSFTITRSEEATILCAACRYELDRKVKLWVKITNQVEKDGIKEVLFRPCTSTIIMFISSIYNVNDCTEA